MTLDPYDLAEWAAEVLTHRLGREPHVAAVVLGSGWQRAADELGTTRIEMRTQELPAFSQPTVTGHKGLIRSVDIGGRRVLVLLGRVHLYEGRSAAEVVHPVRVAVLAGCPVVVLTNAAGGIDPAMSPRQTVLIRDQINLTGTSPLAGPPPPRQYAPRFVDCTGLYPAELRDLAREIDPSLTEGVYAGLAGPQYETPAEIAMLARAGAQLVGMSTTLEAVAAKHLGAGVLGVSLVTNHAAGVAPGPIDHTEVLEAGAAAAPGLARLIAGFVARL
jgi:purine-nucleoside phosphorylase